MPLKLEHVGDVIATRTLVLERDGEPPAQAKVLLGKPQAHGEEFYCPYQIKGAGDEKVRYAFGVDAFQALQLAISILGVEIEVLNKELGGRLRWECGGKDDFGFLKLE
jgi:hypothetical protein